MLTEGQPSMRAQKNHGGGGNLSRVGVKCVWYVCVCVLPLTCTPQQVVCEILYCGRCHTEVAPVSSFTVCSSQESNLKLISLVLARRTCAYSTFHWLLTALNEDAPAHSWSCPKPLSSLKPLLFQGKVLSPVVRVLGSSFVPAVCRAILKPPYYWRSPCV